MTLTQEQFIKRVHDISADYTVLGTYVTQKVPVKMRHDICGTVKDIIPGTFFRSGGACRECANLALRKKTETFAEELRALNARCELAEEYQGQDKETDFRCLTCGKTFRQTPRKLLNQLKTNDTPCPLCSDGISYPEKYFLSFLRQTGADFQYQYDRAKGADWAGNYRYDFFVPRYKMVIEVHGVQHYRQTMFSVLEETQKNDAQKKETAEKNGCCYFVVDAARSEADYIRGSIIRSGLGRYLDLDCINWEECARAASSSMFRQACTIYSRGTCKYKDIAAELGISSITVSRYIRAALRAGICKKNNKAKKGRSKPVICVETGKEFPSVREANRFLGKRDRNSTINDCLAGRCHTAFGYHWKWKNKAAA